MLFDVTIYTLIILGISQNAQSRTEKLSLDISNNLNDTVKAKPLDNIPVITNSTIVEIEKSDKSNESGIKEMFSVFGNDSDSSDSNVETSEFDNGSPLILTKFIEEGRIQEARAASKVDDEVFHGLESYSGFLTVNKTYNSNLFFWYFPVENKPVNETPWLIWLQGGPGTSSFTGLFEEIGPYVIENGTLHRNKYTWLRNHSLLFIDSPVGTGYSFTEHILGFARNIETYSSHLHIAFKQFLQIFPELRVAPLFIAGESYAGKYVPALGMEIHKAKNTPGGDVNLKGFMIGNAIMEAMMVANLSQTFYKFGLLDQEQLDAVKPLQYAFLKDIANNKSVAAKSKFTWLISLLLSISQHSSPYNILYNSFSLKDYGSFLNNSLVKRALHVGNAKFDVINTTVNWLLFPEFLSSTKPMFESLLEEYKVLAYCGQLDMMIPCTSSSQEFRTWNWSSSSSFRDATRYPLVYKNIGVAGYYKSGGGLTEVLIKGAGHMVPKDQPAIIHALVARWTSSLHLSDDQTNLSKFNRSYIEMLVKQYSMERFSL